MTKIYEASNHLLIVAGYDDPVVHSHTATQIIISMSSELDVEINKERVLCQGLVIPSNMAHQIHTHGSEALVFLYDSTTDVAKQVKDIQVISAIACERIITAYNVFQRSETSYEYKRLNTCLLEHLNVIEEQSDVMDERISEAMQYIRINLPGKLLCQEVADVVCLSQSRFSHLFRAQVGMTFASYVIYQRILYVYKEVLSGKSITEATIEAGFSSSTHFADVHRRVFGLSISNVTRECSFLKIE